MDTEFVNVEMEEARLKADGTKVVTKKSRQALARVSVLHGETGVVFMDDYIVQTEPVRVVCVCVYVCVCVCVFCVCILSLYDRFSVVVQVKRK